MFVVTVKGTKEQVELMARLKLPLIIPRVGLDRTADMAWYYELHGVRVKRDRWIISLDDYEWELQGDKLLLRRDCRLLTKEGLCKGHPDKKPIICKEFKENRPSSCARAMITPNCLARYK